MWNLLNTVEKKLLTLAGHYNLGSENWSKKTAVLSNNYMAKLQLSMKYSFVFLHTMDYYTFMETFRRFPN